MGAKRNEPLGTAPAVHIPPAWIRPTPVQRAGRAVVIAARVALILIRNAIPVVGFVQFGWLAQDVVLLGAFNLGTVFTSTGVRSCALPLLVGASVRRRVVLSLLWAVAMVCGTWLTLAAVALLEPTLAPILLDIRSRDFAAPEPGVLWSALALSLTAAAGFFHELHDRLREIHMQTSAELMGRHSLGFSLTLLIIPLLLEGWTIWIVALPLTDPSELGAMMAVTVVTAVSLFLDLVRTFLPVEIPGRNAGADAARRSVGF